jgi:hypothetical protein
MDTVMARRGGASAGSVVATSAEALGAGDDGGLAVAADDGGASVGVADADPEHAGKVTARANTAGPAHREGKYLALTEASSAKHRIPVQARGQCHWENAGAPWQRGHPEGW